MPSPISEEMRAGSSWRPATASKRLDLIPVVAKILVQIAAGVYLFARAKGLSALWHRLRYAGIAQPPATTNRDGRPE